MRTRRKFGLLLSFIVQGSMLFGQANWQPVVTPGREPVWHVVGNAAVCLLQAESGIYRSWDMGQSWHYCHHAAEYDGWLATDGQRFYAANPEQGLFVSVDGGVSWQLWADEVPPLSGGLVCSGDFIFYLTAYGIFRYAANGGPAIPVFSFGEVLPDATITAGADKIWVCANGDIFLSTDAGEQWTPVVQGDYRTVATHADTVLIASPDGLLRSDNGGNDWWWVNDSIADISRLDWQDGCWLAMTESGGLFVSTDGGIGWSPLGKKVLAFGDVFKSGDLLLGAAYIGGLFRSNDRGQNWALATDGLATEDYAFEWIGVADHFLLLNQGFTFLSERGTGPWFSPWPTDGYNPLNRVCAHQNQYLALSWWSDVYSAADSTCRDWERLDSNGIYNPSSQMFDLGDRLIRVIVTLDAAQISRSFDAGISWTSTGLLPDAEAWVVAVGQRLLCLTPGGVLSVSDDDGINWLALEIDGALPGRLKVSGPLVFLFDETQLLVSSDAGENFDPLALPVVDNAAPLLYDAVTGTDGLFVATSAGILHTADWGQHWTGLSGNLPLSDTPGMQLLEYEQTLFLLVPAAETPLWKLAQPYPTAVQAPDAVDFLIVPNPTNGVVQIRLPSDFAAAEVRYCLSDVTGRMYRQTISTDRSISLDGFPPGWYFLTICGREQNLVGKILKH